MKKHLLLITFHLSLIAFSSAQNPLVKQWDKRFGGTDDDQFSCYQQTSDGGFILGGTSYSPVSGDKTQPNLGTSDYWIIKIDSLGIKQWDKRYGGWSGEGLGSLQQTSDGGYILAGSSGSDIGGDKSQDNWDVTGNTPDYWIIKIDSLGIKQWDKRFGGFEGEYLSSVRQTADQGYILGGSTVSGIGGDITQPNADTACTWMCGSDYWIVKTDALGNKQWDKRFGGTDGDNLFSLQQTADGGYILGGSSQSGMDGDKTQPNWDTLCNPSCTFDYWIVKINSLGSKQWDKRYGGIEGDGLVSVRQTPDGGYILGGIAHSDSSGDKSQPNWNLSTSNYWIVKTDSAGNKQWDKRYGGSIAEDEYGSIYLTSDGGYLLAGTSYSPISYDKTENNLGVEQMWIVKTDALGIKQWDKTIHNDCDQVIHDELSMAIQTKDGCYAMANWTSAGIGGDKTQPNWSFNCNPYCTVDYWIIKFCDTTATTSINQLPDTQLPFSIYPNPANESLVVSGQWSGEKEIQIYDLFGRKVFQSKIYNLKSAIDITVLAPGIYFLKAGSEVRKFVKE